MARVKICGLTDETGLRAAIEARASFIGFVFVPSSKRSVTLDVAAHLARTTPHAIERVGLFVNPTDQDIDKALTSVPLSMIQLHGQETPERSAELKQKTSLPVIKALAIRTKDDLSAISLYENLVDHVLLDSAPSGGAAGGTGRTFDWSLIDTNLFKKPWFLAGGLTPDNVGEAIQTTGTPIVDVSSGVEKDGRKDPAAIRLFIERANKA